MGLARMIIEWQYSATFSSILYDSRFVHLLLAALFTDDEIMKNHFDKKKMKFIKGNRKFNTLFSMTMCTMYNIKWFYFFVVYFNYFNLTISLKFDSNLYFFHV